MSEAGIGRLQAMVGFSRAMDLVMTGKSLRSDEALQWGLVNRVASCGTGSSFFVSICLICKSDMGNFIKMRISCLM